MKKTLYQLVTGATLAITSATSALPALAQTIDPNNDLANSAGQITDFINNILVPFLLTLALLFFIYGVFKFFIQGGDDEEKRKEGKNVVMWAIIGFVVIVSIWGIVNLITSGIGLPGDNLEFPS